MSEKISKLGRNAASLAVGGVVALAGLIILLASLSSLLSFAFESLGMDRSLAFFIGALIIGGGATLIALWLMTKAAKKISKESLAPEKTLHTHKKLKTGDTEEKVPAAHPGREYNRSSGEIEASIDAT